MADKARSQLKGLAVVLSAVRITAGTLMSAVAVIIFLVPSEIAPGGVSGIAVILHHVVGTPIGVVVLILNIPIQVLAYRTLGGGRLVLSTIYSVVIFSIAVDLLTPILPNKGVSDNDLLNAIFGGILGGIGAGLIYGAGGTAGGTATLARILQSRIGVPLSSAYLYTDTVIIALAGLAFGWEAAMFAIIALFVNGAVSDYALEGPSVIRTATIVTDHPDEVAQIVLHELGRGVTAWQGQGMFTDRPHSVLFVTVSRPQVNTLRQLVFSVDPNAFMVIGQGHVAYGKGFKSRPVVADKSPG